VELKDTINDFKGVLDGKYDDLPEMAFYMVRGWACTCKHEGVWQVVVGVWVV